MVEPDNLLVSGDVVQNKTGPFFYCEECTPKSWAAVLDRIAQQFHPTLILPDHSLPGDGALLSEDRAFMTDLAARTAALKKEGKPADEAGKILAAEMTARYPGWSSFARVPQGVEQGYRESGD